MRTIFALSARAHERVHVQNVRDFPPRGGGVLPNMGFIGMCGPNG